MARRTAKAVGIPHGDHGDALLAGGLVGVAVADKAVGGQRFDLRHLRLEAQGGAETVRTGHLGRGMQPIHGDAQPHHVEMAFRQAEDGRRVGGMDQRNPDSG